MLPAFAADLPVKAPPTVIPVSNWTGLYAGVNVGYGWGDSDPRDVGTGTSVTHTGPFDQPNSLAFGGSHSQKLNGVIGGDQIGYNYQYSPRWMLGFEADIQAADQRNNSTFVDPITGTICNSGGPGGCSGTAPFTGVAVAAYQAKLEWFGTARGRVGFLVTDQTFFYATGGLAYGRIGVSGNANVSGTIPIQATFTGATSGFGASKTNVGFAVGGGIEGKLTPLLPQNWSWKLEYLYVDLGSLDVSVPFVATSSFPSGFSNIVGATSHHSHFTDNIVRVGINYKLN